MKHVPTGILLTAALAAGVFAAGTAMPSSADAVQLKAATFMSPKHPINRGVIPALAKSLAEETGGSLTLKLFPAGQLGKGPVAQYKRVVDNVAEITFGIQGYTPTIFPRTMVIAQPGVGTSSQEVTEKIWKVYDRHLKSEYEEIKVLALFSNWPPVLISRKKPISALADVKGMKIRAQSPANIPQLNGWGATGVYMPVSKIYNALQTGVLDGVYISPGALYRPWRLSEPGEHVTAGMKGPTSLFFIAMNKKVWNGLSAEHKAAVNKHTGHGYSMMAANFWGKIDAGQLKTAMTEQKGVKFHRLSAEAAAAFDAATAKSVDAYLAEREKKGIPARAIYKAVTE